MFLAIEDHGLHVHHRETGDHALRQHGLYALVDGGQEGTGDRTAEDLRFVLVAVAGVGFQAQADFGELARAAGLFLVAVGRLAAARDGLLVGHAGHPRVEVDPQAFRPADGQVHVRLAHALQNRLARVAVVAPAQGGVGARQIGQDGAHARAVRLGARRDGHHVERRRQVRTGDPQLRVPGAERVAGARVAEFGNDPHVAAVQHADVLLFLAAHHDQGAETLLVAPRAVVVARVRRHRTREDAEKGQGADVTIVDRLEDPGGQGRVVVLRRRQRFAALVGAFQTNAAPARLRRVGDQGLQQGHDADVFRRRGGEDRHGPQFGVARRLAHTVANLLVAEVAFLEVLLDQVVVGFGGGLHQLQPRRFHRLFHVGRQVGALRARAQVGLLRDQVDHPGEVGLFAQGQHDRNELVVPKTVLQTGKRGVKIGVVAVHLVDDDHDGLPAGAGEFPGQLGPHFHAGDRIDHHHDRIRHVNGVLDLALEVRVAGRVQQVDLGLVEFDRHQRGGKRKRAILLIVVPVRNRVAFLNGPQTIGGAAVVEQRFNQRGLARPLMARQGDVADVLACVFLHALPCARIAFLASSVHKPGHTDPVASNKQPVGADCRARRGECQSAVPTRRLYPPGAPCYNARP